MGVLGDTAYFQGGKEVKVGQKHNGATIKEIGPYWVKIEFKGKEKTLHVFTPGPGGSSKGGRPGMMRPPGRGGPGRRVRMGRGRGPRRMPSNFEVRPEMIEALKKMPAERREQILKRMPAEARKKIESQL